VELIQSPHLHNMRIIYIICMLLHAYPLVAQSARQPAPVRKPIVQAKQDTIYENPEIAPRLTISFRTLLEQHLRGDSNDVCGTVLMRFVVDARGRVSQIGVADDSPCKGNILVQSLINAIQATDGKWLPATIKGRKVACWHEQKVHVCQFGDD
jgi:hypothetical protein